MADISLVSIPVKITSSGDIVHQQFNIKDVVLKNYIERGIAPIQENLVAKQDYAKNDKFFYNGEYYNIDAQSLNKDDNLVIGTNCRVEGVTISSQIKKVYNVFTINSAAQSLFSVDRNESYTEDERLYIFLRLKALSDITANNEMLVGQFSNIELRLQAVGIAVKTNDTTDKGVVSITTNGKLYIRCKEQINTNDVVGINIVCGLY